ncbi:MAG: DUF2189 domain-containing protein [Betaproteobacteria bacterium]|nr:DUF2189 domain-containing protein [Betaproteobacteria bacterium]MCL2886999.1 DUF2189 domain-containing protein [Betaproteobacteria bacterium]
MTHSPAFPFPPAPFTGDSREVEAGACFDWLEQGWLLFLANPGVWVAGAALLLVMLTAVFAVSIYGQIAAHLLAPLFAAGMFQIGRQLANGGEARIVDLFIGFRRRTGPLVMVGAIFAACVFGLAFLAFLLVTGGVLGGSVSGKVAGFGFSLGGIALAALLVMVLSVPVIMAAWFAPALVLFHDMKPLAAMRASVAAGVRNWEAMVIFAMLLTIALFFAMLLLGLGLLLLLPVLSGAVYASYRDIFVGA